MLRNEYMHNFPICFCLLFLALIGRVAVNGDLKKEFYIVFLKDRPLEEESLFQSHIDVLSTLKGSDANAKESHVYSYTKIFNAFAAKLSGDEAKKLSGMDEVHAVFKNQYKKLLTTRSWDFLGFPQTVRRNLKMERDIIIGVLDTGITSDSESFKDDGLGPPPVRWKGSCGPFVNFSGCNNKLIGAKYFKVDQELVPGEILSPVDVNGHGTHVSSTAAGSVVANASVYGLGRGTARGAVPSARLAMYKVCWDGEGCADMDILAGVEAAISDGVDILSLSIGFPSQDFLDVVGVASFLAMKAGVITVASAGNDGPTPGTVGNHAPWILTVAATGMDRQFRSKVVLGNGKTTSGRGVNAFNPERKMYPLVFGADAAIASSRKLYASYCVEDSIDPVKVKGKLVLCNLALALPDSYIKSIGGIGTINNISGGILYNDPDQIYMAPGTTVNSTEAEPIIDYYLHSVRSPSAVIYKSQEVKIPAPFMYIYSSRGPSPGSEYILKPDIAAPGVGILAAYTPLATLTRRKGDTQYSKFTFKTGTSMACPHVSGIAAYVKSFHPDWPPAVIKSAIMTTATPLSPTVDSDAEFGYGAGQMNPTKAVNPGLVYVDHEEDYIPFLCREGYSGSILALLFSYNVNCSDYPPPTSYDALNYPTMQIHLKNTSQLPTTVVFQRTVTNVGPSPSIYNATITAPKGVEITVNPMSLSFSTALQERNFKVVVKAQPMSQGVKIISASLSWTNSRHVVRSPIVIYQ